jgi:hypothetical protein
MKGLNNLALQDTADLELLAPDGSPLRVETGETNGAGKPVVAPITIRLLRLDSKEAQVKVNKTRDQRLKLAGRTGKIKLSSAQLDEEAIDLAVFCTRGWTNLQLSDDSEYACSAENARALYTNPEFSWVYSQVSDFINEAGNFVGNS